MLNNSSDVKGSRREAFRFRFDCFKLINALPRSDNFRSNYYIQAASKNVYVQQIKRIVDAN